MSRDISIDLIKNLTKLDIVGSHKIRYAIHKLASETNHSEEEIYCYFLEEAIFEYIKDLTTSSINQQKRIDIFYDRLVNLIVDGRLDREFEHNYLNRQLHAADETKRVGYELSQSYTSTFHKLRNIFLTSSEKNQGQLYANAARLLWKHVGYRLSFLLLLPPEHGIPRASRQQAREILRRVTNFQTPPINKDLLANRELLIWLLFALLLDEDLLEVLIKLLGDPSKYHIRGIHHNDIDRDPLNVLKKETAGWKIRYNGGTPFDQEDSKGLKYLQALVINQSERISLDELFTTVEGPVGEAIDRRSYHDTETGLTLQGYPGEGIPRMERAERSRLQRQLSEIEEKLSKARELEDEAAVRMLQEEKEQLRDYISSSFDIHDQPRRVGDVRERNRNRISNAITRAIKRLENLDRNVYEHFRSTIRKGYWFGYLPSTRIDWET